MKPKVLIVDDDPTLLRFLQDFLRAEAFEVLAANNGHEALKLAYQEHPDLVVLDVMMPGMDGWEVCSRLHELSDIPIILLTAKTSEQDKLRGFQLGVDDYLTKPFSFAELAARIRAILARAQRSLPAQRKNQITFGEFIMDLDKRELWRGREQMIPLTPTEFRLLEYLARNKGRAVSEQELSEQVWGVYLSSDRSAVRRYIWLLRQKIESDPTHPRWIRTVRGYGYRLGTGTDILPSPES
ncbi:response regulator transcription factor [Anaerolinea thermophila]|uniref:OmpR family two-component response regulator n=1 Tax=Anaerolinea thermophila (strain DSM 14523 / JCM 11388 / NBRC 100420 / UNI-1) TaxID=926569 RepID=E8N698_ANATU|nr:response regulator transcription factor [Anaerolinea thermophila]BAJ63962.1 OmpR family two-component response regulator [Anaerolinea thermophila UNI-1]